MKTNPIMLADGSVHAFEIPQSLWTFQLLKILRSVEGVTEVRTNWFSVRQISFRLRGEQCVVQNDPWGSDRYWIGPEKLATSKLDMTPLHAAFQSYRSWWLADWRWKARDDSAAPGSGSAFFVAVVASAVYFYGLGHISPDTTFSTEVSAVATILLLLFSVVFCGLMEFAVVRNTRLSKVRQWAQISGTALFAPLFGFFLGFLANGKGP